MNTELQGYGIVLLFLVGGVIFIAGGLITAWIIRPDRPNEEKLTTYESGEDPVGNAWSQFNFRFYVVALIFLLFEVEIIFLFPWATVFGNKELIEATDGLWGWFTFVEMTVFILILAVGLAYAWRKGYLDWQKPETRIIPFKGAVPPSRYEDINKKYQTK